MAMSKNRILALELMKAYNRAEEQWRFDDIDPRVTKVTFYLSALRRVKEQPFDNSYVNKVITEYLDRQIQKAFDELPEEQLESVFKLMEFYKGERPNYGS